MRVVEANQVAVEVAQAGEVIFTMLASFHRAEPGEDYVCFIGSNFIEEGQRIAGLNNIELITDREGRTAYLKTFRLSEAQIRRGHLLTTLAAHDWHLATTATALGLTEHQLGLRLAGAGSV